ncbi:MAG: peptidyl-prolyl cis-trans isomerase [Gammaproteobacteria bacterium]|nr:MAG: peptidyl-prolyl cis-trans isomerase [Gammaproteobacteria bacterium]
MNVRLQTSFGDILLALDAEKAPKTVENFVQYVRDGFYDGTLFHRAMDGFMVQGGGFERGLFYFKAPAPIENEANNGLSNAVGSIAMARTANPHSASAQFFVNVEDNTFLDFTAPNERGWGYCVLGRVSEGMDIVNRMSAVETTSRAGHDDVPAEDVILKKAEVVED